jgi:hypothetical protein
MSETVGGSSHGRGAKLRWGRLAASHLGKLPALILRQRSHVTPPGRLHPSKTHAVKGGADSRSHAGAAIQTKAPGPCPAAPFAESVIRLLQGLVLFSAASLLSPGTDLI